jgi:transcriptional regulator with XRE-family HTH domain
VTDEFSSWLQRALKARRMTQRQLAALSGVDHSTISRLVRGERRPTLTTATALRRTLSAIRSVPDSSTDPTLSVLRALQGDALLNAADVSQVMQLYVDLRQRRKAQQEELKAAT